MQPTVAIVMFGLGNLYLQSITQLLSVAGNLKYIICVKVVVVIVIASVRKQCVATIMYDYWYNVAFTIIQSTSIISACYVTMLQLASYEQCYHPFDWTTQTYESACLKYEIR